MSAGTRSRAMTATAPASSAILAWSAVTTSMMTPPLSISARPRLTRAVPVTWLLGSMLENSSAVFETPPEWHVFPAVLPAQGHSLKFRLHQRVRPALPSGSNAHAPPDPDVQAAPRPGVLPGRARPGRGGRLGAGRRERPPGPGRGDRRPRSGPPP